MGSPSYIKFKQGGQWANIQGSNIMHYKPHKAVKKVLAIVHNIVA